GGKDAVALRYPADAARDNLEGRKACDIVAAQPHLAGARRGNAENALQRRCLPDAIATENPDDLALEHVETEIVQDLAFAVIGVHAAERQQGFGHRTVPMYTSLTFLLAWISSTVPSASTSPRLSTITRSASENTTSISCSTIRIVMSRGSDFIMRNIACV